MEKMTVAELITVCANCRHEGNREKGEEAALILKNKHGIKVEQLFGGEA